MNCSDTPEKCNKKIRFCISDGEEQGVRSRGKIPVLIPSQAHDGGPDPGEVLLAPQPSDAESIRVTSLV